MKGCGLWAVVGLHFVLMALPAAHAAADFKSGSAPRVGSILGKWSPPTNYYVVPSRPRLLSRSPVGASLPDLLSYSMGYRRSKRSRCSLPSV